MKKESLNGQNAVSKIASKTVGPIVDLEQHLHPDWWKRIFNSMYLKTDADVVEDSQITKTEVDLFKEILDIKQ
ncbi:MAG: D-alanine-D-alanine ligase, partial [Glaciecola sp.]